MARNSRLFNDVQTARKARNASKVALVLEPKPVKTPELVEATYKRMWTDAIMRTKDNVAEAKDRFNKAVSEVNSPDCDSRNLWALETVGSRLEILTEYGVILSVKVAVQEGIEADQQNGKSFREACRRERERMIDQLASIGSGLSSSAYHNAHESVKANALRTSLRDVIRTLGWVIDELDAIAAETKLEPVF